MSDQSLREALEAVLNRHECIAPDTPDADGKLLDELLSAVAAHPAEPASEVTHAIADGEAVTACCGRTPFELPKSDRITVDLGLVNCPPDEPAPVVTDEVAETVTYFRAQAEGCEQLRAANDESGADLTAIDYHARAETWSRAADILEAAAPLRSPRPAAVGVTDAQVARIREWVGSVFIPPSPLTDVDQWHAAIDRQLRVALEWLLGEVGPRPAVSVDRVAEVLAPRIQPTAGNHETDCPTFFARPLAECKCYIRDVVRRDAVALAEALRDAGVLQEPTQLPTREALLRLLRVQGVTSGRPYTRQELSSYREDLTDALLALITGKADQ